MSAWGEAKRNPRGQTKIDHASKGAADESSRVPFPESTPGHQEFQIGDRPHDRPQKGNKPEWREDEADRDPKGQQDLSLG
jgi:hypothetical protein